MLRPLTQRAHGRVVSRTIDRSMALAGGMCFVIGSFLWFINGGQQQPPPSHPHSTPPRRRPTEHSSGTTTYMRSRRSSTFDLHGLGPIHTLSHLLHMHTCPPSPHPPQRFSRTQRASTVYDTSSAAAKYTQRTARFRSTCPGSKPSWVSTALPLSTGRSVSRRPAISLLTRASKPYWKKETKRSLPSHCHCILSVCFFWGGMMGGVCEVVVVVLLGPLEARHTQASMPCTHRSIQRTHRS